jgi:hypothetical protein
MAVGTPVHADLAASITRLVGNALLGHGGPFVSPRRSQLTVIARTTKGWDQREYRSGQQVELDVPKMSFGLDELLAGMTRAFSSNCLRGSTSRVEPRILNR